jgi:dihydrofolate reductase
MARRMNAYRKLVFSRHDSKEKLAWNNSELVTTRNDEELVRFVRALKEQDGAGIHLAGGARLAQTFARLGLVDEYRFFIHPVVSNGASWFGAIADKRSMELVDITRYDGGVVGVHYRAKTAELAPETRPQSFNELHR